MKTLKIEGVNVRLDDNGYLVDTNAWNEKVAEAIAANEGIRKFTAEHLDVVIFLRKYYLRYKSFPMLHMVCTNLHKPSDCATTPFLMDPLKAWKVAGLPQPGEEVLSYLEGPPHVEKPEKEKAA